MSETSNSNDGFSRRTLLRSALFGPEVGKQVSIETAVDIENQIRAELAAREARKKLATDYLASIQTEQTQLANLFGRPEKNPIEHMKTFGSEAWINNFNEYYPFYKNAAADYDVPWELLMIVHVHETTCSTEKNPQRSGFMGAMQRHPGFWKEGDKPGSVNDKALKGGFPPVNKDDFLQELPQRYKKPTTLESLGAKYNKRIKKGYVVPDDIQVALAQVKEENKNVLNRKTNDWWEIRFAAWFLKDHANSRKQKDITNNREIKSDNDYLGEAMHNYCAGYFADQRVATWKQMRSFMGHS